MHGTPMIVDGPLTSVEVAPSNRRETRLGCPAQPAGSTTDGWRRAAAPVSHRSGVDGAKRPATAFGPEVSAWTDAGVGRCRSTVAAVAESPSRGLTTGLPRRRRRSDTRDRIASSSPKQSRRSSGSRRRSSRGLGMTLLPWCSVRTEMSRSAKPGPDAGADQIGTLPDHQFDNAVAGADGQTLADIELGEAAPGATCSR